MSVITISLNGFYMYNQQPGSDEDLTTGFDMVWERETGTVTATGRDGIGAFTIIGLFDGTTLGFYKEYDASKGHLLWKYRGQRLAPFDVNTYRFSGDWGSSSEKRGKFVLSGIVKGAVTGQPVAQVTPEGRWVGFEGSNNIRVDWHFSLSGNIDGNPDHVRFIGEGLEHSPKISPQPLPFKVMGLYTFSSSRFDVFTIYTARDNHTYHYIFKFDAASASISGTWKDLTNTARGGSTKLTKVDDEVVSSTPRASSSSSMEFPNFN